MRAANTPDMHSQWIESSTVRVLRPGSQIAAISLLPPPRRRLLRHRLDVLSIAVSLWFAMFVGFTLLVVSAVRAVL